MSCQDEIHVGDIGTVLTVTIADCVDGEAEALDISTATTKTIYLRKPSGSILTKTAVFVTDGSDGLIKYTTIAGDLNEYGTWRIQAYIVDPNGNWKSNIQCFEVYENLN